MKSEYFKKGSQPSNIRGTREKKQPESKNWDKIIYLSFVAIILFAILYVVFFNTFFVTGEGVVVSENVDIKAPNDINVENYFKNYGEEVQRGDSLFSYVSMDWAKRIEEVNKLREKVGELENEQSDIEDEIYLKNRVIELTKNRIDFYEEKQAEIRQKVELDLVSSTELSAIERDLFEERTRLEEIETEQQVLNNQKDRLDRRIIELQNDLRDGVGDQLVQVFNSPVSGRVTEVYESNSKQIFRSERVLRIKPEESEPYIMSFFPRDDVEHLEIGMVFSIDFDNGEKSEGAVRDIYDAREDIIEHFEQTGNLVLENVIVELTPIDSSASQQWSKYNRMGLQASRTKYGILGLDAENAEIRE
jgi:multidrug resistance efflux pump